ncbi:hypothetical protein ACFWY9_04050 [Amycolatopsis sp. NPDC059027]|uniref:hypothetical protein n=1 Tax=unclassified Amycolatopsis TaxID=2618356 RepID=UPI00366DC636
MREAESMRETLWRGAGGVDLALTLAPAGIVLGQGPGGSVERLTCAGPQPSIIGVVDAPDLVRVLAFRLLGAGCSVSVRTPAPARWKPVLARSAGRLSIVGGQQPWPSVPPTPLAPQALLAETDQSPDAYTGAAWTCVLHDVARIPVRSPFWSAATAVLVGAPGHGKALGLLGRFPGAEVADRLPPGHLARCTPEGTRLLRLATTPAEHHLSG